MTEVIIKKEEGIKIEINMAIIVREGIKYLSPRRKSSMKVNKIGRAAEIITTANLNPLAITIGRFKVLFL